MFHWGMGTCCILSFLDNSFLEDKGQLAHVLCIDISEGNPSTQTNLNYETDKESQKVTMELIDTTGNIEFKLFFMLVCKAT